MTRLAVVLVVLARAAWADIPPSDSSGCRDKAAGATCKRDDGSEGTCATSTCTRNDYSNGPPPKRVSSECLKCVSAVAIVSPVPVPEKKTSCATIPAELMAGLGALVFFRRRSR